MRMWPGESATAAAPYGRSSSAKPKANLPAGLDGELVFATMCSDVHFTASSCHRPSSLPEHSAEVPPTGFWSVQVDHSSCKSRPPCQRCLCKVVELVAQVGAGFVSRESVRDVDNQAAALRRHQPRRMV